MPSSFSKCEVLVRVNGELYENFDSYKLLSKLQHFNKPPFSNSDKDKKKLPHLKRNNILNTVFRLTMFLLAAQIATLFNISDINEFK
ncbi:23283_t:CDS:2 [Gigaspora margarita]|uniref:23283_t:CDS:1 n=1 Tax=Gigaspora margarita TaxID=4874 RepID=A0ABM8W788_GIGMA|nr:23283_t:CDS:2 [Gigaspora margarita]